VSKKTSAVGSYSLLANNVTATSYSDSVSVYLTDWLNLMYQVESCNSNGCSSSPAVAAFDSKQAIGYFKASNIDMLDIFGSSLAISSDGNTLAVGAYGEDSGATGVNNNSADNSVSDSGAVYVFTNNGGTWSQQAYIKASNTDANDHFGIRVTLSSDGNTLAVGAPNESSNATGINNDQADNSAAHSGAVYVFTRSGSIWSQQAYVKASNTDVDDRFGVTVALSSDGNTLAVGAEYEDSSAVGVNGIQTDNGATDSGAVYLFTRSSSTWSQQAYIKASNTDAGDSFGATVALSGDGATLAVGGYNESSNATGIGNNQTDNGALNAGAVYLY
jgi:FG-GAP repeat